MMAVRAIIFLILVAMLTMTTLATFEDLLLRREDGC